jgi:hypothetical protein
MNLMTKDSRGVGRMMAILGSAVAPVMMYLVIRNAAVSMFPAFSATMPPVDESASLRQVAASASHPDFRVDQPTLDLAKKAAASQPLDYLPFYIAGRAAERRRNLPLAVALMEEARRRRPSWLPTRLQMISLYFRSGRTSEMAREIGYVLRISDRARTTLLPELVKLARQPETRRYLAEMLADNPPWKVDFYAVARDQRLPPGAALDLLRLMAARGADVSQEERLYISTLIVAGRADMARARWLGSLPAVAQAQNRFLFNGDFNSGQTDYDFGWKLQTLDVGRADMVATGGGRSRLRVQYFGGSSAVLAQQQIALSPGRYRMLINGRASATLPSDQLSWVINCDAGGREVMRVSVNGFTQQDQSLARDFVIPAGDCPGQHLRLVAEPGEVSAPIEVEFASIGINNVR